MFGAEPTSLRREERSIILNWAIDNKNTDGGYRFISGGRNDMK